MSKIASYRIRKRRRDRITGPFRLAMEKSFPGREVVIVLGGRRVSGDKDYCVTVWIDGFRCSAALPDFWGKIRDREFWLRVMAGHFVYRFKKHFGELP